jgi:hypothetical protein
MAPRTKSLLLSLALLSFVGIVGCDNENPIQPSCVITLQPASLAFTSDGGTGTVAVSTSLAQCEWTAAASTSWMSIVTGASGTGSGSVTYNVAPNATPQARTGSLVIGSQVHSVAQNGQDACAYDVSPASAAYDSAGGQGTLTVSTTASCAWTATTSETWLRLLSAASGQGGGAVTYAVAAHTGSATRTGVLHVAGYDVQVTQSAPGCSFAVSPQNVAFGSGGGQGSVSVSAPSGCSWSASTGDSWLTVVQGTSGQGDGTVIFNVAKLTSADARAGAIRIAGVDVRVVQSGDLALCEYSIAPVTFSPCMPASTLTTTITTSTSCPWTASASVTWLKIAAGESGTGPGTITLTTSDNYDAPRTGTIMVRWPTLTAGQNVQVAQAGCLYAVLKGGVPVSALSFTAAGGSDSFDVIQESDPYTCGGVKQDQCVWAAVSDATWITITTPMPMRGDHRVSFTVSAHTSGLRTGSIRVSNKVISITQFGS